MSSSTGGHYTRHLDDFLQTTSTPENLDRSLRRIDEQARLIIDEQGVNTLFLTLGMVHYKESRDSEQIFRAPLILVPVRLERASARAGYKVVIGEDEPLVNPALREYLKRSFGLSIPDLPSSEAIAEDYDLQDFFKGVTDLMAVHQWTVTTEIHLGLFSFHKFVMYKDIEANEAQFLIHPRIMQLADRTGNSAVGLSPEIRSVNLDDKFPAESTGLVVDADSSQLRALLAVSRGYPMVIEGPPGTGKSQTITNIIAQALAAGKSVLFVAEKMAALQVVHNRLVQAGFGEFCLELHSTKANKRAVMKEIAAALDASLVSIAAPTSATQRLPNVRTTLNEYVAAAHTPVPPLGISPFRAYGELGAVLDPKRVAWSGNAENVSMAQINESVRHLKDLAIQADAIGEPSDHPWRDATRSIYTPGDLESIADQADDLCSLVERLAAC